MRRSCKLALIFVSSLLAVPALGDTLDDVLKKLDEAYMKVKSYSAKMKMTQEMEMQGFKTKSLAEGMMEFMRKDGKIYSRTEMKDSTEMSGSGIDNKSAGSTLLIIDGEFTWSLREELDGPEKGKKSAVKSKIEADKSQISAMKEYGELKLMPDEKVDGVDCVVVEMKPKGQDQGPMIMKNIMYVRKDSAMTIKMVSFMGDKQVGTMTMTDVKLDADLPASHFVFKVPEGVTVEDTTKAPKAETPAPAPKP